MTLFLFTVAFSMHAQTKSISGVVSSKEDGLIPGVSVLAKGTTNGTTTNAEGKFKIENVQPEDYLVFSAIGYATIELPVGNKTKFDVILSTDTKVLNEVVVTALGISREKKSLGFSQQEVKGESLTEARSANVANGLSGKIAGVQITSNGGPGSGSNIII